MPKYTLERGGKTATIESPTELAPADIEAVASQHFGAPAERGEGDKVERPTTPESIQKDVLNPGQPKPLDPIQKAGNIVAPIALTAPTIAAGGMALPAAPIVGEALAAGALGGAKSASKGESPFWGAFVDAITSAGWGGAMKLVPGLKIPFSGKPSLGDLQGRKSAYESVAPRVEEAFNAVKSRLPSGKWVNAPTIGKQALSPREAIEALKKLEGDAYRRARVEIASEFAKGAKGQYAGRGFAIGAPKERFTPPQGAWQSAAEATVPALRGQTTAGRAARAGVEAAATEDLGIPSTHIPVGALPALGAIDKAQGFGDIAKTIMRFGR